MPDISARLGLELPLETDIHNRVNYRKNLEQLELVAETTAGAQAKADEALAAATLLVGNEEARIDVMLAAKEWNPVILNNGLQIIQGGDIPAILHPEFSGRTLINLLGRNGNCEDINKFSIYQVTITLDSTNKVYGNNGIKATISLSTAGQAITSFTLETGKYYIGLMELKNGNALNAKGIIAGQYAQVVTDNTKFQTVYKKLLGSSGTYASGIEVNGVVGQYAYVDGIRLYEISLAEYNAIDTMTPEQIAAKYPYVDDVKHVNGVYMENKGTNLIPPFSAWTLHASAVINDPYKITANASAAGQSNYVYVPLIGGQQYTLKTTLTASAGLASMFFDWADANGSYISTSTTFAGSGVEYVITPPANAVGGRLYFQGSQAGTFTFSKPMLNPGTTALPFEPQKPSYMYIPKPQLRSSVDGSVRDELYTDGYGNPRVTRCLKEQVFDDKPTYVFGQDYVGYKAIIIDTAKDIKPNTTATLVKYDGKVLSSQAGAVPHTGGDQFWTGNQSTAFPGNEIVLSTWDVDSGWGDSYTPTDAEIKLYFDGWRMCNANGSSPNTDPTNKYWFSLTTEGLYSGSPNNPPTRPTAGLMPYRLMYQLAASVDEAVEYEGSLMLHEGANQVEVGTGIVVREASTPLVFGDNYFINRVNQIDSRLINRVSKIVSAYKNNNFESGLSYSAADGFAYGKEMVTIPNSRYDKTASYATTYLALDAHALGIAPQTINAKYAPNIRESVDSLVREVVEARTEISVLRNTKAQKQQPQWITPSVILNGWTNISVKYYKDELGIFRIRGRLGVGITDNATLLFIIPLEYRQNENVSYTIPGGVINIDNSGNVRIYSYTPNGFGDIRLDSITYRVN